MIRLLMFLLFPALIFSGEKEMKEYMKKQNSKLTEKEAQYIYNNVIYYSKEYNVDPILIFSVMKTESHFRHSTISSAGAKGLMQLMPFNFKEFGVDNSVAGNIKGGIMHLKRDYEKTKDVVKTLVCYNAGCGRLKNNEWHKIKETTDYVTKINNVYPEIKQLYYANTKNTKKSLMTVDIEEEAENEEKSRELTKQEKFQKNRIAFKRSIEDTGKEKNEKD